MKDAEQLAQRYHRDGFVWPIDLLTAQQAEEHHDRLVSYEATYGSLHYLVKPYLVFSSAWEIASHPRLLHAVESIIGPDILLWDGAYVIKEPHSEGFVSWHQDLTYWGLETDADDDVVSAWIALTPAQQSNGCMQFVAGSHQGQKFQHADTYSENNILHRGQTIVESFRKDQIRHLEMNPGQASLHHGWAVHSSNPNASEIRRVALALNFARPSVRQRVTQKESATLVRGEDRFNHFLTEPVCGEDRVEENVRYQQYIENLKREVYDKA